jgi:hypothetical protein
MRIVCQPQDGSLHVQPTLEEEIKKAQHKDKDLMKIRKHTREKSPKLQSG